jgi:Leucine-rich repeat (LRR) protein
MSSLEKLSLDCNLLTLVPEGMHELPSLRFLNLSSNKIASRGTGFTKFPPRDARERLIALSLMPKVETLLLSGNVLEEMPPDMCALFSLTELGIGNNRITELPREIIHLTRLRSLNVDRCQTL